jgi:2'-5' RNA ligase
VSVAATLEAMPSLASSGFVASSTHAPQATGAQRQRLFIGLWPDERVRALLQAHQAAWCWPRHATRVRGERLHLTLHFLGDVPLDQVDALCEALQPVPVEPLRLEWQRCAVWPGGIAVLEPAPHPALHALHERIAEVLADAGLALQSRLYRPHVTLARRAAGARPPADLPPAEWQVDRFALVASVLRAPPRYEVLAEIGVHSRSTSA